MNHHRIAGLVLIVTSLGFVGVFAFLAANFGYPAVLDGAAAEVLPAFVAGGPRLRWVWAVYAALPTGVALAATLAYPLLRSSGETRARLGLVAALISASAMTAGLMRWPTLHYVLGQRFAVAGAEEQRLLSALFDAANLYLGNVAGEFIGELTLCVWFATTSLAIAGSGRRGRWLRHVGLFTTLSLTLGAFRNVTSVVAPVAELNNSLLPLWLIALGAALLLGKPFSRGSDPAPQTPVFAA
jgi:hypothetical protein